MACLAPSANQGSHHTLLVVGRNNQHKKSRGIACLLKKLESCGVSVRVYESKNTITAALLDARLMALMPGFYSACTNDNFISRLARKTAKALLLLAYPSRWGYFLPNYQERYHTSTQALARFIRKQNGQNFTLLTHSAGGIAGSLLESLENVNGHICFGYPFKHPERPEESRRTRHLRYIKKPFLIVQGNHDEYGDGQASARYALSPAITVRPVEADHNYDDMSPVEFDALLADLQAFLDVLGAHR